MKILKKLLQFIFLTPTYIFAQTDSCAIFYLSGIDALSKEKYELADSLIGLSIKIKPYGDTYLKKSTVQEVLGNKNEFCKSLLWATFYNSKEAGRIFCEKCGTSDTIYKNGQGNIAERDFYQYKEVTFKSDYSSPFIVKMDKHNNSLSSNLKDAKIPLPVDSPFGERLAEFPGGLVGMQKFLSENLKYSDKILEGDRKVKVIIKFLIIEDGTVDEIRVIEGNESCPQCVTEAIRVVNSMPKWSPAIYAGKPVKTSYSLPINFKIK